MKNNYVLLAEVLRKARLFMGYSKRSLAESIGISHTELTRIENGNRENFNLVTLINICKVLHLDFVTLLKLTGYLPLEKGDVDNLPIDSLNEYVNEFKDIDEMKEAIKKEKHQEELIRISIFCDFDDDDLTPNFDDLL